MFPLLPLTWHIRGILKFVVGTAIQGTFHKIWRLIHVLEEKGQDGIWEFWFYVSILVKNKKNSVLYLFARVAVDSTIPSQHERETHNPHAIKGHLVVEIFHHVIPPLLGLWVGEVREGSGAGPNLKDKEPGLSRNASMPAGCIYYLCLKHSLFLWNSSRKMG